MMRKALAIVALALLTLGAPAYAKKDRGDDDDAAGKSLAGALSHMADKVFEPEKFFDAPQDKDILITVNYKLADADFPALALALKGNVACAGCKPVWVARLARGGAPPGNPHATNAERGRYMLEKVSEAKLRDPRATRAQIVENAPLDWLEASASSCPAVEGVFQSLSTRLWLRNDIFPQAGAPPAAASADWVELAVRTPTYRISYSGPVMTDAPSGWANDLLKALEPCWGPATVKKPWSWGG